MLDYKSIGLEEAQTAIAAIISAARSRGHPGLAIVVVDKAGDIIAAARMDGKAARFVKAAHRKAYTAAVFERDTSGVMKFWNGQQERGHRGPSDWNDPMLTTLPGGFVIMHGRDVTGGLGVAGGNSQMTDDAFAEVGVVALGAGFRHREEFGIDRGAWQRPSPSFLRRPIRCRRARVMATW